MLAQGEQRTLSGLRRRSRSAVAVGLVLALSGGSYGVWGAGQFRTRLASETRETPAVSTRDPVARLGLLFAPYQKRLGELETETETERILLRELDEQTRLAAQLLVLLVRILFASLVVTVGMILFASGWSNRRVLSILDTLLEHRQPADRSEP
jgi:hypothetical protein